MAQTCGISPEELRVREGEFPQGEAPLETAWTFWYDKKTTDKKESNEHMANLRQLGSFNTIEGFYRHYSYLLRPSELPRDHNCYMFRKHYKPMWEEFPEGGCWIIRIKRKASQNYVNHMWENLLLACIGEAFEMPDVVGCVLSTRLKDDVLSVWNLSNRGPAGEMPRFRIGERLKEILDLNMTALIQYKDHMQSLQDYSTYRNAKNYMFAPSPNVTPQQGTMDTPVHSYQGNPDQDFDQGMLPPAAMDDMLPPAAVDSEGWGVRDDVGLDMGGWGVRGEARGEMGAVGLSPALSAAAAPFKSPALSAAAAPFTPPTAALKSPLLSAEAAPWLPPAGAAAATAASAVAAATAAAAAGVASAAPGGSASRGSPSLSCAAAPWFPPSKEAAGAPAASAAAAPKSYAAVAALAASAKASPKMQPKSAASPKSGSAASPSSAAAEATSPKPPDDPKSAP